jgi:hypothetical protein
VDDGAVVTGGDVVGLVVVEDATVVLGRGGAVVVVDGTLDVVEEGSGVDVVVEPESAGSPGPSTKETRTTEEDGARRTPEAPPIEPRPGTADPPTNHPNHPPKTSTPTKATTTGGHLGGRHT